MVKFDIKRTSKDSRKNQDWQAFVARTRRSEDETTGIVRGPKLFDVSLCHQFERESLAGFVQTRRRGNAENSHLSCRNVLRAKIVARIDRGRTQRDCGRDDVGVKGAARLSSVRISCRDTFTIHRERIDRFLVDFNLTTSRSRQSERLKCPSLHLTI